MLEPEVVRKTRHVSKSTVFIETEMSLVYTRDMNRRLRNCQSGESGILDERVLVLVFGSMNWDPHVLSRAACVSRKLRAVAKRILWKELCISRAPRMVSALTRGAPIGRVGVGWHALAKLLFFCCGCEPTRNFPVGRSLPGHFVGATRFSKTSGNSFLARKCWGDLLYVSDPCEHAMGPQEDDVGVYRGVFGGFMKSRTRAYLIRRQVQLEQHVRCPYCRARVWSMTEARLVPRSASRRLGAHEGRLDYFVCVNGHLHGQCWLVPLSSDDDDCIDGGGDVDEVDDDDRTVGEILGGVDLI